jgi:hypothetical protein
LAVGNIIGRVIHVIREEYDAWLQEQHEDSEAHMEDMDIDEDSSLESSLAANAFEDRRPSMNASLLGGKKNRRKKSSSALKELAVDRKHAYDILFILVLLLT